jgi:chromate transporter
MSELQDIHQMPIRQSTRMWFGISLRTFGGPAGQIAVMHEEIVEKRKLIGESRFLHALSFCTLLPGPEAQQLAIYLGWLLNGTTGGLIAGTLFVVPGFVAMMALSAIYAQWGATKIVTAIFFGLGPAVIAIVVQAVWRMSKRSLKTSTLQWLAIGAFFSLVLFSVPFPLVILLAGVVGVIANKTTVNDDVEPLLVQPKAAHPLRIIVIGLTLWFLPIAIAAVALGRDHVFVDEGLFFSGTAVVTFGGAYAVLSFVAQRAVNVFGWLLPGEMVNGLALAETTPGPLIMVVQFVAFLGAFRNAGSLNPWVAGVVGSSLVVWVTFVPCFLFVFLGAPYVERLRTNRSLSAAMSAVSAAVVGVIANLSVYFSLHTLFDDTTRIDNGILQMTLPAWDSVNIRALVLTAFACVLVFRYKWSTVRVMLTLAVVGCAVYLA